MRMLMLALLSGAMMAGLSGAARADYVPPFKGNDTGGIISTSLIGVADVDGMAVAHCAQYGKVPKKLAVTRRYGMYLSFACVWSRTAHYGPALRVRY